METQRTTERSTLGYLRCLTPRCRSLALPLGEAMAGSRVAKTGTHARSSALPPAAGSTGSKRHVWDRHRVFGVAKSGEGSVLLGQG